MRIDLHVRPGVTIVEPQGRLTVENESGLTDMIRGLHDAGQTRLVLDLRRVPAIDSCGLGAIAQACVSTWSRGGTLRLANVSDRNRELLTVTRLASVFAIYDSIEEAAVACEGDAALRV
jgi:anti-sigma B factor antagonist